jgi:hypothetical protein
MKFRYWLTRKIKLFPRSIRFWWQRRTRGWDDSDTWSLDNTMCSWLLPRIKRFKELNDGYPSSLSEKEWNEILDKIIESLEWYQEHCYDLPRTKEENLEWRENKKKCIENLHLLAEYWSDLWW